MSKRFFYFLLLGLSACEQAEIMDYQPQEVCVSGVVYLRSPNGNLTPKINADFYPYQCLLKENYNG